MSRNELQGFKKYLENNLSKEFFQASSSCITAPVLHVKKPEGSLRFIVNYCTLNAFTIENKYLLPLIRETLDRLYNAVYFTKFDIVIALNKIHMAAGEKGKTVFKIYLGLYIPGHAIWTF